ncbi:MAG: hypothetical protein HQ483_02890 [Rhodospirillales bacterium]|nr:hypothetical protein [Rhodospirillales bacterium]
MIRRSTLLTTVLALSTGLALFVVKYQVQDLEDKLTQINREIADNNQAVHVLNAEWSHLNEPNRLRHLAARYLDLGPLDNAQFTSAAELLEQLPLRVDADMEDNAALGQKTENALKKDISQ